MKFRTLHSDNTHYGWDNGIPPVLTVAPGERLEFRAMEASSGQLTAGSTHDDVARLKPELANPILGPIFVEGAEPGDALAIEFLDFGLGSWGWTAIIPGFGLLSSDFDQPYLHISRYDEHTVEFTPEVRVPLRPFAGTVGLAPAASGRHSVIPPRRVGGNLDCRDLVRGSTLYLPVEVPGALLSLGDPHAAQGDGEVCGTAVETSLTVEVEVTLKKQANLAFPRARIPTMPAPAGDTLVTMGVGPDLMSACKDAVREMIDELVVEYKLTPELAYCLCSVTGNLRVSEIVDQPNWVVAFHLPTNIFS